MQRLSLEALFRGALLSNQAALARTVGALRLSHRKAHTIEQNRGLPPTRSYGTIQPRKTPCDVVPFLYRQMSSTACSVYGGEGNHDR
jgi:hypothetical protein